jgi:hypothetical protein
MAPKRKGAFPATRLYDKEWGLGEPHWAAGPKPLNEAIPERGFEDAEFLPNLPNQLFVEYIWPKICKPEEDNKQSHFWQALTMRNLSKFWCTFVEQTDVIVDMHCSFILKKTAVEKAAASGRFRHWRPRLVL